MRLHCPICCTTMTARDDAADSIVTICPACVGVIALSDGKLMAIGETDLLTMRQERPDLIELLEQDRIRYAARFVAEEKAPTIFAAVAARMYVKRGPESLRLPGWNARA